jgi:DNA polymerase (family 10)
LTNYEISKIFRDIAKILEIKGENVFRIRAYDRAAQAIEGLAEDLEKFIAEERLTEIPGIGKDLSEKIKEFSKTGKIKAYEELKKSVPQGLLELLNIPSIGPKTAKLLFDELKIKNIDDLIYAIELKKLQKLPGIKERTIENILRGIEILKKGKERMTLAQADMIGSEFAAALKKIHEAKKVSIAGSLRRRKETVRDIDILVVSNNPKKITDAFTKEPSVKEIIAKGETKSSLRTNDEVQVDCRVVEEKSFGAALLYFTGSKDFNIKLRQIAIKKGLKLNEYGIFKKERYLAGKSEEEMFNTLGLAYIEPELREDTGEVELARANKLPDLVELKDIKGDLHVHSNWSDGGNTILEMAKAGVAMGYSYIAVTDHSQGLKVAGGLSISDLKRKKAEVDKINKTLKNFMVLYGAEVDIDSDGKLDYNDEVLKNFDIVVAAIHSGFKQSKERITRRIISACKNKNVHIIAHPTGKLWGVRDAYEVDIDEVLKAAKDTNTQLEVNSFSQRLDLNDHNCRRAKELGVKIAIGSDSHATEQLQGMRLGISVARRGWLSKRDVINTLPLEKLLKVIKK